MEFLILISAAYFLWWIVLPVAGILLVVYLCLIFSSFIFSVFNSSNSKIDKIVKEAKQSKSKEELKYPYIN
jgi:phosphate/sulfate permease